MYKAVILEDDTLSSWDYEMILDELGVSLSGTYKSWKQALPKIKTDLPDLMIIDLFLDKNESALDFLKEMQNFFIPSIVVSGFLKPNLIEQALENNVIAFIPKPFDKTVFTFHVKKLLSELSAKEYAENHFTIRYRTKLIKIPHEEIMLIKTEGNYSEIILESGKKFVLKISLTRVLVKLNPNKFLQCYRSSVININKVASLNLQNNIVTLTNKKKLKVGLKYRAKIVKALQAI